MSSSEDLTIDSALRLIEEKDLLTKMDNLPQKVKSCPDCGIKYGMDDWYSATELQRWRMRDRVPFNSKRRFKRDGSWKVALETRCRTCNYNRDKRSKAFRGLDTQGRPVNSVGEEVKAPWREDTPENRFLYGRKSCASS